MRDIFYLCLELQLKLSKKKKYDSGESEEAIPEKLDTKLKKKLNVIRDKKEKLEDKKEDQKEKIEKKLDKIAIFYQNDEYGEEGYISTLELSLIHI